MLCATMGLVPTNSWMSLASSRMVGGMCYVSFEIEDSNFVPYMILSIWMFRSQKLIYCVNSTRILQIAFLRI